MVASYHEPPVPIFQQSPEVIRLDGAGGGAGPLPAAAAPASGDGGTRPRSVSLVWTTSACSIARSRCRPGAMSTSPTAPRGWRCTRSIFCGSRWNWRCTTTSMIATKFFQHFLYIAHAMENVCGGSGLWDEADEFYYDVLNLPDGERVPLRVRSAILDESGHTVTLDLPEPTAQAKPAQQSPAQQSPAPKT